MTLQKPLNEKTATLKFLLEREYFMEYQYKTKPFKHQAEVFEKSKDLEAFGLFWEQGTGKTKPTIDTAAYLYETNKIDAVVVVAPNGVHHNWANDEINTHLPERIFSRSRFLVWNSSKAKTIKSKNERTALLSNKGLSWLLLNYDSFNTQTLKDYLSAFLRRRRCLFILDESHYIKTPGAKRTKTIIASSKYAPYRRILTGTPVAQGPFDLYSQVNFLDKDFWQKRGLGKFYVFKFHFGVWLTAAECKAANGYDPGYDKLLSYKNIDELSAHLKLVGDRLTKEDVLDLPPKLYTKRYFELTKEQARIYEELRDNLEAELSNGKRVDGALAITRLMRLQQIICGYVQTEDPEEPITMIGNENPLLEAVLAECQNLSHPAIIWARFTKDIDQLMQALGEKAVRYDGKISAEEAEENKEKFQKGDAQFFVSNPQKGSTGLTLTRARSVMYYSNSFNLVDRLQSEDRAHRIGQSYPVNYIDFEAILPNGRKTVSANIIKALRDKYDISAKITGDELKEWI